MIVQGIAIPAELCYTGKCLDEWTTGRFAFLDAIEKHNTHCGQSAPYQVDSRPAIRLGNDGKLGKGRFAMPDKITGRFVKGEHWRTEKPYWNREWLYNEYVIKQRSAKDIADDFGCIENNILYFLQKHQIPTRTISETRAVKHWGANGKKNPMYGRRGAEVPNWKGGITAERQGFYASREWKKAALSVWRRDRGICRRCGAIARNRDRFHIHHIVSFQVKELRADVDNLILLCPDCHNWVHSTKNINRDFIKESEQKGGRDDCSR